MAEEINMYRKEAYSEYEIIKYRRLEVKKNRRRKNQKKLKILESVKMLSFTR